MQRICAVPGGVNAYSLDPRIIVDEERRRCPFCEDQHRLRSHGYYERCVILPGRLKIVRVLRFLCPKTGRTVSLLPEFCLPARQVGPGLLGLLLHGVVIAGLSVEAAVYQGHLGIAPKTAWSLLHRLRSHLGLIGTYLGRALGRIPELPESIPRRDPQFSRLAAALLGGASPSHALAPHAREFHRQFHRSLA